MPASRVIDVVVCPACRGELEHAKDSFACRRCQKIYPLVSGIPCLYPPSNILTIDPAGVRIKGRDEALRTIRGMRERDYGLIKSQRIFYVIDLLLVVFLVAGFGWGVGLLGGALVVDWLAFRIKRGATLSRFLRNPLRLRSVADYQAVDEIYRREGRSQPTMSDWANLSREALGEGPAVEGLQDLEKERYLDTLRVYEKKLPPPEVVVDVGANDGRAYYEFGIGRGKTFIAVDVSVSLLEQFLERVPDQIPIVADGVCLPLKDESVDFLFSTETLEHLADPDRAVREFMRVLKPGGWLMVQSPNAHRIRNMNLLHLLTLVLSLLTDRVLQKTVVHENSWLNTVSYHWDFSVQDYRRMVRSAGGRVLELRSFWIFFPTLLIRGRVDRFRKKERILGSIPALRYFGEDLVLVAEKQKH
jgi:ubiquinone/menaquinone biosynthesis C-methylase UbiE/uncharacterized protein YbaR (Trm112 family)